MSESRAGERDGTTAASTRRRTVAAIGVAVTLAFVLAGCFPAAAHRTASAHKHPSPVPSWATPDPAPTAIAPDPALSHPATPGPVSAAFPSPTLRPVPAGTVVASGDVASPKGSIHFHYAVVSNGNNTYSARYSGVTSTVPVPVSVTFLPAAPRVGDGLSYHGVGAHQLGSPKTGVPTASAVLLDTVGPPSYLGALVTYSSATSSDGIPVELGPNKVLAVNTVHWAIPVRQSNVHPVDHGSRSYASGKVTARTASGAPKRYLIAPGDITSVVAQRFGVSVQDLIWLNSHLEVFGSEQYLYEGTTLNLDPNSL